MRSARSLTNEYNAEKGCQEVKNNGMKFDVSRGIEVLSVTPATLRELLGSLSDVWTVDVADPHESGAGVSAQLSSIQNPKSKIQNVEWSPFDIVGHLIHGEQTDWIPRARVILEQGENRMFVPFDRFAQFENSNGKSLSQLLDEFAMVRAENVVTLQRWDLGERQLDLEGMHPELGKVTLRQLLATWVVHDLNHIRQIVAAMARLYDGEVGAWKEYLSILNN